MEVLTSERAYMREEWLNAEWMTQEMLDRETLVETVSLPESLDSPFLEGDIGQFRPHDQLKLTTADEGLLRQLGAKGLRPGFREAAPRSRLRFDPRTVNAAIITVGGTAPSTNAVVHAIVQRHRQYVEARGGKPLGLLLGVRYGFGGLMDLNGSVEPMVPKPYDLYCVDTEDWRELGGSALELSRYDFTVRERLATAATNLIREGINILYVIGGDGGQRAAHELWTMLQQMEGGREIVVAGIPKTMDNDVAWVWHSLGFRTALAEASRFLKVLKADARANHRIILVELFGAEAGFIAANSALACGQADCVLIPEESWDPEKVLDYIRDKAGRQQHALVVLAEGALSKAAQRLEAEGKLRPPIGLDPEADKPYYQRDLRHLTLQWIRDRLREDLPPRPVMEVQTVCSEPGYLIRAVPGCAEDQGYAQRLGDLTVDSALAGYTHFVLSQWLTEYVLIPLSLVSRVHKRVPRGGMFWREVVASTGQPSFA